MFLLSQLAKKIDAWVTHGLITRDQSNAILSYENNQPGSNWAIRAFLTLGGIVISIGIISVIAANWYDISDGVKLGLNFMFLGFLGYYVLRTFEKKEATAFEVAILCFTLSCLALIGLISQIYHVDGELYEAFFLWSVITLGVFCFSEHYFNHFFWTTCFVLSLACILAQTQAFMIVFSIDSSWMNAFMMIPLLCVGVAGALHHVRGAKLFERSFQFWILISGLIAIFAADIHVSSAGSVKGVGTSLIPGYILAALLLVALWVQTRFSSIRKIFITSILVLYVVMYLVPILEMHSDFVGGLLSIMIFALAAIHFGSMGHRKTFNMLTLLIGLRFLIFYFQALGGLARTGFGLIVSGALIIGMVILWQKTKPRLQQWAKGLQL